MKSPKFRLLRISAEELKKFKGLLELASSGRHEDQRAGVTLSIDPELLLKTLAAVATNTWRAKTKLTDPVTGEIREDMRRVGRHVEAIYRNLAELGVVIRDHTGDAYDEGQPMKVIASKPTEGLDKKRVSETLLPSIFLNDHLIQNGEIEVAIPVDGT